MGETEASRPQTFGEYRVGITFNPSGNEMVHTIKTQAAALIDLCHQQAESQQAMPNSAETVRLWSLAMTHFEDAAMWAVKAATKVPR